MAGPESTFSRRAVTAQVKEQQALELRLAGHTYDAIAAQVGYVSQRSAYRAVGRAFQRIRAHTDETAEQLRQLEDTRYDRMLRAIDEQVQQGDLSAIDRALRISIARRKLWGLDAPVQIQAESAPRSKPSTTSGSSSGKRLHPYAKPCRARRRTKMPSTPRPCRWSACAPGAAVDPKRIHDAGPRERATRGGRGTEGDVDDDV